MVARRSKRRLERQVLGQKLSLEARACDKSGMQTLLSTLLTFDTNLISRFRQRMMGAKDGVEWLLGGRSGDSKDRS